MGFTFPPQWRRGAQVPGHSDTHGLKSCGSQYGYLEGWKRLFVGNMQAKYGIYPDRREFGAKARPPSANMLNSGSDPQRGMQLAQSGYHRGRGDAARLGILRW